MSPRDRWEIAWRAVRRTAMSAGIRGVKIDVVQLVYDAKIASGNRTGWIPRRLYPIPVGRSGDAPGERRTRLHRARSSRGHWTPLP